MRNKKKSASSFAHETGIVLLTTILMISTLSIIVLSLMQAVFMYAKTSRQLTLRQDNFYRLESAANTLITNFPRSCEKRCLLNNSNPNAAVEALKQHQCVITMDKQTFYYVISDLGAFPCLQIMVKDEMVGSHHWLVSVTDDTQEILQIRVAHPSKIKLCQSPQTRNISFGRMSWRLLSGYNLEQRRS